MKPAEFAIRHTRVLPEKKFLKAKKCQESPPNSFQAATVFKAKQWFTRPFIHLCHSQKLKSKPTWKQNRKTNKQTNYLKKTNSNAGIEKHILALNIKHKHICLNLKEMLPLRSHFSNFLVPNYAAPLEAFSHHMTAPFPKINHGAGYLNCTKWEQISCLNLNNLEQALTTALDGSLLWTHWASRPRNTASIQYSTEHSVTEEEVVSGRIGKTQHLQANSKKIKPLMQSRKSIILWQI